MSNAPRKFQGVWIPADLWLDRSLSITEKVMLVEINSLQHAERGCYASNAYFAEFFGLSPSRVSEIINRLAEKGLVAIELVKEGRQIVERRIRPLGVFGKSKGYSENTETPIRKTEEGYSEKAKENNTKSNNTGNSKGAGALDLSGFPEQPSDQVWADYLKHRRTKRASVTQTVINSLGKELWLAFNAGWSVDEALAEAMAAGWQGLKYEWLTNRARQSAPSGRYSKQAAIEERNRQAADDFVNGGGW